MHSNGSTRPIRCPSPSCPTRIAALGVSSLRVHVFSCAASYHAGSSVFGKGLTASILAVGRVQWSCLKQPVFKNSTSSCLSAAVGLLSQPE